MGVAFWSTTARSRPRREWPVVRMLRTGMHPFSLAPQLIRYPLNRLSGRTHYASLCPRPRAAKNRARLRGVPRPS
jgi:hypothetical protein